MLCTTHLRGILQRWTSILQLACTCKLNSPPKINHQTQKKIKPSPKKHTHTHLGENSRLLVREILAGSILWHSAINRCISTACNEINFGRKNGGRNCIQKHGGSNKKAITNYRKFAQDSHPKTLFLNARNHI